MQHAAWPFDTSDIPWILQSCFSSKPVFGRNFLLIFRIIYQIVDQNLALWCLPTAALDYQNYPVLTGLAIKMSNSLSSLIDFREIRPVWHFDTSNIEITQNIFTVSDLIMPKPVYLMTVHEAHQEYNSLIDQIRAKYELLDSGECGSVGTPAFNAECSELAHLMARMSELCKHLNLPMPKELHRPPQFKHWIALNSKLFACGRFS